MDEELRTLRNLGAICFEKDGKNWVHVHSIKVFEEWIKNTDLYDMVRFQEYTLLNSQDIIGKTVHISTEGDVILHANRQDWWNSLDLERIKAVMNDKVFGWALNAGFLAHMTELQFLLDIVYKFGFVCGKRETNYLSEIFTDTGWDTHTDTAGFLCAINLILCHEYEIYTKDIEDDGVQYFI